MRAMTLCYTDAGGSHSFPLEQASTSIGRAPDRDIVIGDPSISRRHALILREGDDYTVEDLNSTHGTFLNGARIRRATLKAEDLLQLGSLHGPRLHFRVDGDAATQVSSRSAMRDLVSSITQNDTATPAPPGLREMERLNWLLRAARRLNEGDAIADILSALVQLTLELTGLERGFVFLQHDHDLRLACGLSADGTVLEEDSTVSRTAMQNAVRSLSRFSVNDTRVDKLAADWPSVMENQIRSIYCIPLRKPVPKLPGTLLGLLYLDSHGVPGELTGVDEELLGTIATEATVLVQNALLAEEEFKARQAKEELAVAATIHRGLMSATLPAVPYAALQAESVPCLAIGGDFYDVAVREDCLCATIADISGKGVSAAIVAATLQGILHSQLLMGRGLDEFATLVNQFLCTRNVGKYATMVVLKLFPDGKVDYINCGHILPYCILGREIRQLEESNLVVGLVAGAHYTAGSCVLRPQERILLVTDGLTEAENPAGEAFGESGMRAIAHYEQLGDILDRVAEFQASNPPQDDCTLLAVQYKAGA